MCLFTCSDARREDEEEDRIMVAARPVQVQPHPTIIRTAATFPVQRTSRPVSTHGSGQVIALQPVSPRGSPHGSSHSHRSSPRGSGQEIIINPRGSNQQVVVRGDDVAYVQITPDRPRPIQRTSSQQVRFADRTPPILAARLLRPVSAQVVPVQRRSAGNIVIQRSSSQRAVHGPRISDSVLIRRDDRIYATGQVIAPRRQGGIEISPRGSRVSQVAAGVIEIQTAGGRGSRRQSAVMATTTNPRNSDIWRPSEKHILIDNRGNRIEYYR